VSNVALFPTDQAKEERFSEADLLRRLEAERLRIARELHDVVSHSFATITVQAGVASRLVQGRPEQVPEALHAIKSASQSALHEIRTILGTLREPDAPAEAAPGLSRLESLAAGITRAGVPTRVVVYGEPRSLPVEVDKAAYRIVQESLTNVVRHARGATARVVVFYGPREVVVTVEDDGRPRAARSSEGGGHGIRGMRERAQLLGGELQAGTRPENGFRVSARLPTGVQR
jgi:signal transduction histidine kinase